MKLLKENDFSAVMIFWYKDLFDTSVNEFPGEARKLGLEIESVHLPFSNEDYLWIDGIDGDIVQDQIINYLETCSRHQIEKAVMHPIGWKSKIVPSQIGVNRYNRILEKAEKYNIELALENTSGTIALDYLFKSITSPKLRFCYDNGHEHIFKENEKLLMKYASKLSVIHLTDNNGVEDQHLLPFSGTVDWSTVMDELYKVNYSGLLSFEVGWQHRSKVKEYTDAEYIRELKRRADKLLKLNPKQY